MVFLHGWQSEGLVWQNIARQLAKQEFRIYLLDLPGFGGSTLPKIPFCVKDYCDIAANFAKRTGLEKIILIGHSFGGRIAIKLAAEQPELVKKLMLVDADGLRVNNRSGGAVGFLAKLAKPFFRPRFMQGLRRKIYRALGSADYIESGALRETYLKITSEDLSDYLPKIEQPTLIVWGENDQETPLKMAKIMQAKIPNSQLKIIKNAGHFSFLDQPPNFYNLLLDFLKP